MATITTTAPLPPSTVEEQPRVLSRQTMDDRLSRWGSAATSLALTWLIGYQILPWHGVLAFVLTWYGLFLLTYATVTALGNPRPVVSDRLVAAIVGGGAATVGIAVISTVLYTVVRSLPVLPHLNLYAHSMEGVSPTAPLSQGGVLHAVIGSLIELGIATLVALPLGIATAVYMTEVGGRLARVVRTIVEAMTALPDILAGLFIYVVLVIGVFHFNKSGLAAALALSVTMLPIIARAAEVVLRVVPGGLREAGLALGATHWSTVWRVVLPTARPGLSTAVILGMARAIGETAPVLIVSGAATVTVWDPLHGQMNSLPLFIFTAVRSGEPEFIARGFAAGAILLALVLGLFALTRYLARNRVGTR
jgi:phosphate transport system permease protein